MFSLKNKTAVITGGGSGIGKAIAVLFAQQGAMVHIIELDIDSATSAVDEIEQSGGSGFHHYCDVSKQQQVVDTFNTIGRVDILVNNAGIIAAGSIDSVDLDALGRMTRVNFDAVVRASYLFARVFKSQGSGAIINVSSIGAYLISRRMGAYGALKHALETLPRRYTGVVTTYERPFSDTDHDAISANMLWLGTWRNGERTYFYAEDAKKASVIRYKQ